MFKDAGEREREDAGATIAEVGRARRIEREEKRGFVGEERDDAEDGEEESLRVSDAGEAHLENAASDRASRGGDRETQRDIIDARVEERGGNGEEDGRRGVSVSPEREENDGTGGGKV